jgi:hypothetical protein
MIEPPDEPGDSPPDRERRRPPRVKKTLAYKKDHRISEKDPHLGRRCWPKKKVLRNQTYRTRVRRAIDAALRDFVPEEMDVLPVSRRKSHRFHSVVPLGTWVRERLDMRARRTAYNFFKQPYNRERHRAGFVAFLEGLTRQGHTAHSRWVARYLDALLNQPERWRPFYWWPKGAAKWLRDFFRDEPAWRGRLEGWIAGTKG